MSKIRNTANGGQVFYCPGCNHAHAVNTSAKGPKWAYNGNADRPTFGPSILVTTRWSENDPMMKDDVCHSYVTGGRIQFLGDSTHKLAGQTVDLPDWPYAPGAYGGIVEPAPDGSPVPSEQ